MRSLTGRQVDQPPHLLPQPPAAGVAGFSPQLLAQQFGGQGSQLQQQQQHTAGVTGWAGGTGAACMVRLAKNGRNE
ncbi:MAG: hypothetical protein IPK26_01565 [Planctomycetes bacterium]|nr:hypothetical protein [Planctomycetota bacterium]